MRVHPTMQRSKYRPSLAAVSRMKAGWAFNSWLVKVTLHRAASAATVSSRALPRFLLAALASRIFAGRSSNKLDNAFETSGMSTLMTAASRVAPSWLATATAFEATFDPGGSG
ncbi:MAG: hypothetical protein E5X42_26640 [Mesorhizobium sp.]|nr:MAG: hypothetical protein E5X42_26640 [Mesorhizobium sp.]